MKRERGDIAAHKLSAREMVLAELRAQVKRRGEIVRLHPPKSYGDSYRREIKRLWTVALRAVKDAA